MFGSSQIFSYSLPVSLGEGKIDSLSDMHFRIAFVLVFQSAYVLDG